MHDQRSQSGDKKDSLGDDKEDHRRDGRGGKSKNVTRAEPDGKISDTRSPKSNSGSIKQEHVGWADDVEMGKGLLGRRRCMRVTDRLFLEGKISKRRKRGWMSLEL